MSVAPSETTTRKVEEQNETETKTKNTGVIIGIVAGVALVAIGLGVGLGVYYGVYAEQDEDPEPILTLCDQNPCLNSGTCENDDTYGYVCFCPPYFTGRHCQVDTRTVLCEDLGGCCVPWLNETGSRCSNRDDTYRCYCDAECLEYGQCCTDFKEYCQWDACKTNQCLNGGQCILDDSGFTGYRCQCSEPFTGTHCQVNKDNYLCADNLGCCIGNDTAAISCSRSTIGYRCYCDDTCQQTNDCCVDYDSFCLNP